MKGTPFHYIQTQCNSIINLTYLLITLSIHNLDFNKDFLILHKSSNITILYKLIIIDIKFILY